MAVATKITAKETKTVKLDRQVTMVRHSPCGKFLMAGGFESVIYRWDATKDMATLPELKGHGGWVECIAFGPDKRSLFSADSWGQLRCWDYTAKEPKTLWQIKEAHDGWIRNLAVSPDGKQVATCGSDLKVRLWSAADGKKVHEISQPDDLFSVAFHPDGKSFLVGDLKGIVRQYQANSGKLERTLNASVLYKEHRLQDVGGARCLRFNPKGNLLACAGTTPKNGGNVQGVPTVLVFDWATGKVAHTIKIGSTSDVYVYDLHLRDDGVMLGVTSGNPGVGKFFIQKLGEAKPSLLNTKMTNCHSMSLHPDGKQLVIAATNRGSNGNGRRLNKDKEYVGNYSPLHIWALS